jgi:thioesterase domain-containing protein/acyl carrier protein
MSRELANAILERDVALWNMYGPTETTIWSSVQRIKQESGRITIGHPIGNNTFYVLDPAGQPVPIGVVGELHIGGDGVARGYLNRQELTRERFLPDPFTAWSSTKQMYRTGDLARYLADGRVEYLGRLDFQVKIHGHRIELGEIAAILSEHPHVRQVVVTVYSNNGDQSLVAYLLPHEDIEKPTTSVLREYLRNHLPGYMIPSAFVYLTEFPLTPNRKIDTRALPPPDKSLGISEEFVAPRNQMEEMLLPIWQDVLQREPISIYDNFFELGGHSLIAARLFAEIEAVTGKTMPLAQLFSSPTIAELSAYMMVEHKAPDLSVIVPIQPKGDESPFFYVAPYSISVLQLHDIAQNFSERPFYGIQPLGLGEGEETHTSIEAMAAHNIEAMRSIQPQGPYYLGGHCSGSWVAYEMAAQLEQLGETVAFLAIVDNHAPTYREPGRGSMRHQISRLLYYLSDRRLFHALAWQIKLFTEKWLFHKHGTAAQQRIQVVRNTHDRAFENYKATHNYTGPMTIIRSSENIVRYASDDWYKLWQEMTIQEIEIVDIHSTHAMLVFNPQAEELAHHILTGIEQSNK